MPICPMRAKPGASAKPDGRFSDSFALPNTAVVSGGGASSGSDGYTGISAAISLGAIFGARLIYTDSSVAL